MPHYAVTIALQHKGEIVAGVIYDAAQDECFFAEKGQGAWMNETRMRVSGRRSLSGCVFATGLPSAGRSDLPQALTDLAQLLPVSSGVRSRDRWFQVCTPTKIWVPSKCTSNWSFSEIKTPSGSVRVS